MLVKEERAFSVLGEVINVKYGWRRHYKDGRWISSKMNLCSAKD